MTQPLVDPWSGYSTETARLENEVAALKRRVAELEARGASSGPSPYKTEFRWTERPPYFQGPPGKS